MTARTLLVDVRPLVESPTFRAWWLGSALSVVGSQFTSYALLFYVWSTTHRAVLVGGVAVAQLVPTVLAALVGGALADRGDRRTLVLRTRLGQLVSATLLAVVVATGRGSVVVLYLLVAVLAGCGAAGAPANRSFTARLLPASRLGAGLALTRLTDQLSLLVGPMVAGLVTALWGVSICFVVDAATFLAAIVGVARLPVLRPLGQVGAPDLRGLRGALRLVATTPVLLTAFLTDLAATTLAMPVALFPVVNDQVYGGSAVTLGLFAPAIGLGGILAGALSGRATASPSQVRLMLVSASVWAAALLGFGLTRTLWTALALLAVAGAADTISVVTRSSIVQRATPDHLRGRVGALDYLVGVSGPQVGNFRAGLVASATSGPTSAVLGGAASLAALLAISRVVRPARRRQAGSVPASVAHTHRHTRRSQ